MIVTTLEGYAVKALIYIASKKDRMATIKEISENNNVSFPYILRICSLLRQHGVLKSIKGRKGGYKLSRKPSEITLYEIVQAVGRSCIEIKCDFGKRKLQGCYQIDCPSLPAWAYVLDETNRLFSTITLASLIERSKANVYSSNTNH